LGVNQDFKMHHVYKEIVAISQVLHENMVRYYACWIESVSPKDKAMKNAIKKIEGDIKRKFKYNKRSNRKQDNEEEVSKLLDLEKSLTSSNKRTKRSRRSSIKDTFRMELLEKKWKDKNLLTKIEEKNEVLMDEDWNHYSNAIEPFTPLGPSGR